MYLLCLNLTRSSSPSPSPSPIMAPAVVGSPAIPPVPSQLNSTKVPAKVTKRR